MSNSYWLDQARISADLFKRAPPPDNLHYGEQRMLRQEAILLFQEALNAINFFEPHFQIVDEVIAQCSWWFRLINRLKPNKSIKLRNIKNSFKEYIDEISLKESEFVILDSKLIIACNGWISWYEAEMSCFSKNPYR